MLFVFTLFIILYGLPNISLLIIQFPASHMLWLLRTILVNLDFQILVSEIIHVLADKRVKNKKSHLTGQKYPYFANKCPSKAVTVAGDEVWQVYTS